VRRATASARSPTAEWSSGPCSHVGGCRATTACHLLPWSCSMPSEPPAWLSGSMGRVCEETQATSLGIVSWDRRPFAHCAGGEQWSIRHRRPLLYGGSRRRGRRIGAAVRWLCWDVPIVAEGDSGGPTREGPTVTGSHGVPRPNVRSTRMIVRWGLGNRRHDARPADPTATTPLCLAAATNPNRRTIGTIATGAVQVSGTSTAISGLE
jgi:hypothetical protein